MDFFLKQSGFNGLCNWTAIWDLRWRITSQLLRKDSWSRASKQWPFQSWMMLALLYKICDTAPDARIWIFDEVCRLGVELESRFMVIFDGATTLSPSSSIYYILLDGVINPELFSAFDGSFLQFCNWSSMVLLFASYVVLACAANWANMNFEASDFLDVAIYLNGSSAILCFFIFFSASIALALLNASCDIVAGGLIVLYTANGSWSWVTLGDNLEKISAFAGYFPCSPWTFQWLAT